MDIKQALLKKSVDILESAPILFDNIAYKYQGKENELNYKLYLIQKGESSYVVCAITRYVSDDSFTDFLEAFDHISHPLSLHFYKEFQKIEEAKTFYEDVLQKCPDRMDLKNVLPETCEMYGFDERESIHYDSHFRKK